MRVLAGALALGLSLIASAKEVDVKSLWEQFKADYSKQYDENDNGNQEEARYQIFQTNVENINEHNSRGLSWTLGINQFADLTSDEFGAMYTGGYLGRRGIKNSSSVFTASSDDAPDSVDWVEKGAVTPVKDQGQCGSCWAFSTIGAIEGAYYVSSGNLLSLSEEDFVQCDHSGDEGCGGGDMESAMKWAKKNGICSEDDYPYTSGGGKRGKCRSPKCKPAVHIGGQTDVAVNDEDAMKAAVAGQPVSVAIEADTTVFQMYNGGVIDSKKCGHALDHAVLVVGYGTDKGTDYWKVKNSWAKSWGEDGYVRIARGKNMCGIAKEPCFPTSVAAGEIAMEIVV